MKFGNVDSNSGPFRNARKHWRDIRLKNLLGLYLGIIKPDKLFTKLIRENFLATLILTATSSTVIGLVAFLVNFFILNNLNPDLILIAVLSGIIGNLIEIPLTLFVTIFYFKRGDDPNNSIGPFVSTTGDIVNILALLIAIKLV